MAADPEFLKEIVLFASMDDEERGALARIMGEESFREGQVVYEAGDQGGTMHVILEGEVEISLKDDGGEKIILDELGTNDFFGELSLLDGGLRSATVTALCPTRALKLRREDLLPLLHERPHMAQDMMGALVKIVRRTDALLRGRVAKNANEVIEEQETFGARIADAVARFGGSWTFIFSFGAVLVAWVVLNTIMLAKQPFDPYPFILLNLFLSMIAALQAPVIMMSQNRQDAKDRIRSELDYQVNLRAELGVNEILRKVQSIEEKLEAAAGQVVRSGDGAPG
jgi:CRP/FNR family transcriptional regulator, cyclic AMP receptor protein